MLAQTPRWTSATTLQRRGLAVLTDASTQAQIERLSRLSVTPVTLAQLIHVARNARSQRQQSSSDADTRTAVVDNARFLSKELPVRLAKRCTAMQHLPFIVGTNPHIRRVYNQYWRSFEELYGFGSIRDERDERSFAATLTELVSAHADVIPTLSKGFAECRNYILASDVGNFLDKLIHARIGLRVLAEHHLALHAPQPSFLGIIDTYLSPAQLTRQVYDSLRDVCLFHLGHVPQLIVDGHVDTRAVYIPVHLEYMVSELLKNSMRATVEHWRATSRSSKEKSQSDQDSSISLPPIRVTVASEEPEVTLRFRDQGGGVPYDLLPRIFEYSYTTVADHPEDNRSSAIPHTNVTSTSMIDNNNENNGTGGFLSFASEVTMQGDFGGPMAGQGYGLGTSRVYSKYFGGTLHMVSMYGYGCDVFLRVRSIDKTLHDLLV